MEVTILQHAKDNSPGRMALDEVAALIRGEGRPEAYQPLMVIASVLEGGRQRKHIRWLTGLAVAHLRSERWKAKGEELDEARRMADDDMHTMLCFADEHGDGLYIVYPFELFDGYQLDKQMQYYSKVFAWGSDYYAQLLGVQADRTCCEELDAMSNAEMNKMKSIMTMRFTDDRIPFDRYPEQRKHIASYCGTGNNIIFLNDKTGTRRFLPFEVDRIDDPRMHPIDYEGVYSQAYALYQQGFRYYFTEEEEEVLKQHNQRFETPRPEEDLIDYYFRKPGDNEVGEVLPVAIAQQIVCTPSNRVSADALARAFESLGYECAGNGGYRLVQRSKEEREQRACSLAYEARYGIRSRADDDIETF